MKNTMEMIRDVVTIVIDTLAILVQVPYVFVSGMILTCLAEDDRYPTVYVWEPLTGFICLYIDQLTGHPEACEVTYCELLKK